MLSRAAAVGSTQIEHMVSFNLLSFDTESGFQSMSLTAIQLDSEAESAAHMALVSGETPGIQEVSGHHRRCLGFLGI